MNPDGENNFIGGSDKEKLMKLASWTIIILAVFLAVKTLGDFKALLGADPAYNSISVTGEGEVVSLPDVATFSFSVSRDAGTVQTAQSQVTEKMDAVIADLKTAGIEERDIKTTDYSVWPKYRYSAESTICSPTFCPPSPGRQIPDGYTVSHSIVVKIRNTEKAGEILAMVGEKGATNVSGLSFTVDDPNKVINDARALAIADARERAEELADKLDVRLVRVVNYYDSSQGQPIPYGMGGTEDMMLRLESAKAPDVPTGENKTKVVVTVVYQIR